MARSFARTALAAAYLSYSTRLCTTVYRLSRRVSSVHRALGLPSLWQHTAPALTRRRLPSSSSR